jgi:hypothetical protein
MPARWRTLVSTGAKIFWATCDVCGKLNAALGYGCINGAIGRWYCDKTCAQIGEAKHAGNIG